MRLKASRVLVQRIYDGINGSERRFEQKQLPRLGGREVLR